MSCAENMNKEKIIDRLSVIAIIITDIYFGIYALFCLCGVDAEFMAIPFGGAMLVLTLLAAFRTKIKKLFGKAFPVLQMIFTVLLWLYLISVAVFFIFIGASSSENGEYYINEAAENSDSGKDTVILVFGCKVHADRPSDTLALRLDEAVKILNAMPESVCIVTGGKGESEPVIESYMMKKYLIAKGIDKDRIFEESDSHSTSQNVRFTKAFIENNKIKCRRIIGVSTAFHIPRIRMLSQRYELPMEVCASGTVDFPHWYVSIFREYLSYIKMALFDDAVINVPSIK